MLRILIVDDDENTLIAQEALLENAGFRTVTAWGGKEGLKALAAGDFDLLLLDDYLPGVDADALVQEAHAANIPVVMLCTSHLPPHARIAGCETVHKWTPAEVRRKVEHVLRQRAARQAA